MMKFKTVVLHIGHHKSGTTYIQEQIFRKVDAHFVNLSRQMLKIVQSQNGFERDRFIQWIHSEIHRKYGQNEHQLTIISHEQLSGHPRGYDTINAFLIADNLKQAFPNAKILIVIRNQFDYMVSLYTFRVAIKGYETRSLITCVKEDGKLGLFKKLEYDRLVKYYMDLFGEENVLVLPLELLKIDPACFHEEIANFLHISSIPFKKDRVVNESTKLIWVLLFWRFINLFFACLLKFLTVLLRKEHEEYPFRTLRYRFYRFKKKTTRYLNKIFPLATKIVLAQDFDGGELLGRYAESNTRLCNLTALDLKSLGYPMLPDK